MSRTGETLYDRATASYPSIEQGIAKWDTHQQCVVCGQPAGEKFMGQPWCGNGQCALHIAKDKPEEDIIDN